VSLSSGDEAPHIFTRKSHLQPGEFLITSAKRLLQQNLPISRHRANHPSRRAAGRANVGTFDPSWQNQKARRLANLMPSVQ
jgi:hypothetical protein